MRVPLSWLREFVDIAADVTPEQMAAANITYVSIGRPQTGAPTSYAQTA